MSIFINSNLINILHQDAVYQHQHKLILTKALKWERQKRNFSILLWNNNQRKPEISVRKRFNC
ncbi:hypothetical protein OA07_03695 [Aphanizomenon flos-aquae 2012/KM1/D3]|nr:hypothetical protein OA07_03695 [Aphanizomenon flos-aquae 2012/KM1/D3]